MVTIHSTELYAWIAAFLWPLTRILGLIATAPLFSNFSIPVRVKLVLGILLAMLISPTLPPLPAIDLMSPAGLLLLMQQFIIGLAMGFAMRIVFAAVEMAGEIAGMTMGLGFATFFDPQSQGRSSAISQFLSLLTIMVYLATDLHLTLLAVLVESFQTMPISATPLPSKIFHHIAAWGGRIFSAGVQLSLPIVAALLIINIALGILTRAAPALNLFGIGFPVTIGVGLAMLVLVLPYLAAPLNHLFHEAIGTIRTLTASALPPIE